MRLELPFYLNNGDEHQCMQVAMQVVLDFFLDKRYDLTELDQLTGRGPCQWTWTPQIVKVLYDLGLEVKLFSAEPLEPFLEGEPFLERHFGAETAEKMLRNTDWSIAEAAFRSLLETDLFEHRKLALEEVEHHLLQGRVPIVLIDHNVMVQNEDVYNGHCVVVTGFDNGWVTYHESGPYQPCPHYRVPRELFLRAWHAPGTDSDLVLVYGPRSADRG